MDRIKIKITNFIVLHDYPLWENYRKSKYPNRHIHDRIIVNDKANVKRPFRIKLMLYYDDMKDEFTIGFNGSIRKWYFGKNNRCHLRQNDLIECVKLLSLKIGIREQDLWNAKITQLEFGTTLLLKSYLKEVMRCLVKYRNFERKIVNTTLYFEGKKTLEGKDSNFKLKFYEKNLEINKYDKSFYYDPIKMNVHEKFFFFRFEIDIRKVSGVKYYKQKANTLWKINNNWKEINLELFKRFLAVQFVDLISDEKVIDITSMGKIDLKKYLQFKAIRKNGFFEEMEKFEINNTSTNRSTKLKSYCENYEMFLDKKIDYKNALTLEFKKKLDSLL